MTNDSILDELNSLKRQNAELEKRLSDYREENDSLKERMEELKQIFDFMPTAVLLEDAKSGSILDANDEASLLYGYSHNEFLTLKYSDLSAESDNISLNSQDKYIIETFTYHCKKDGVIFPVEISINRILFNKRYVNLIAVKDNRERLNADTLVREALSRFDTVLKNTPFVAIQSFNRDGIIQYWNPACEILYGYNALEAIGKPLQKILFIEKETVQKFENLLKKIWISQEPVSPLEWQIITRTGSVKWILSTMFPILSGDEIIEVFCMNIDITDRKLAEKAVKESEELFLKMVSTLPDLVVQTDIGGYISFINDKWLKIIISNYNVNDILGRHIYSFFSKEDIPGVENYIRHMYENKICPEEFTLIIGEDNYLKFDINGEILRLVDGNPYGMVFVCRDITERKKNRTEDKGK